MKYPEHFALPAGWLQESDRLLGDAVARWAEREVLALRGRYADEQRSLAPRALRSLLLDVGLLGIGAEGGPSAVPLAAALEQVARADPGIALAAANSWLGRWLAGRGAEPPAALASEEEMLLLALVLPGYGDVASADRAPSPGCFGLCAPARAVLEGERWMLRGGPARPLWGGDVAHAFAFVCEVGGDGEQPAEGPLLIAVPRQTAGLHVGDPILSTGLWASGNAEVVLEGALVPRSYVLLAGRRGFTELLCWHYLAAAAIGAGAMLASWEILREWTDSRVIKGKGQLLKENPLAAALLGEISGGIATSRLQVFGVAQLVEQLGGNGDAKSAESILAQAAAVGRAVLRSAMDALDHAMELMGSAGYAADWSLERYWRDIKDLSTRALLGTTTELIAARYFFALTSS